jgi:hypothetical protein
MKFRFPVCSELAGRKIQQGLTIMDLTGFGMTSVSKKVYGLVKVASQIGSDYYPEIMGNMLVVNAPYLFSGVWSMVKGFLDERTRNKIKIVGGGYTKVLLEYIDEKTLPDFLGGKCTCSEFGGCMKSNLGPWNEFERVKPFGVRRKGTIAHHIEEEKKE